MKEFDFQNPWDVDGKYYTKNSLSDNIIDLEKESPEPESIVPSGTIIFDGLNDKEIRNCLRIR